MERNGRLHRLELHTLGLVAFTDTQFQLSHRWYVQTHRVFVERKVLHFVLRHAVTYLLQIPQVTNVPIDSLLRIGHLLDAALKLCFGIE